ncbi:(Fe-S)-binding protein [Methanobrevibacter sp. OttesenSCG-928-K11]|nr:(Fe-S)-binding protein [Methanobrevibacter sp. OttesenSCG-928-K11]MDL2270766.1 (Fe-S)-binding protein [Methanobrevibacter sp. OttesenSCG-928-I08]
MIYFRGCTAREKETGIAEATENLLKRAGIDYKILDNENCCGSVLFRTGFREDAQKQVQKNMEDFNGETILTSCAGCYKTLKNDYDDVDVIHITQLLEDKIDELNLSKKDIDVTYHDSCHLSRHCKEYDAPRNVIKKIANLKEMENIKEEAICCGAGGGVKSAFPDLADKIAESKLEEIEKTNVEYLLTACPFCKLNLKDKSSAKVLDITEFISEVL